MKTGQQAFSFCFEHSKYGLSDAMKFHSSKYDPLQLGKAMSSSIKYKQDKTKESADQKFWTKNVTFKKECGAMINQKVQLKLKDPGN